MARMKRGIRPINVAERNIAVDTRETHQWEAALSTLDHCLEDKAWQDANLRLIVADHWARYVMVPWSDELSGDAERLQHARLCMANTFGDIVAQWTITISDAPPGFPQVACAVPSILLDRLRLMAEAHGLRIKSVQPHLIASFNGWRAKLPRGGAWFVTLDEGSIAAAHFSSTHWDSVRSVRIGNDWEVELRRLQTFGRLVRSTEETSRVLVDAPRWLREKSIGRPRDFEWLDDADGAGSADRFALLQRMYA